MSGPFAAILAAMISAASIIGGMDCSAIVEEAQRIIEEQARAEEASEYLIAIDAGHQEKGNFGQEPVGPGASETKTKVAGGTRGTTTGVPEYQLTLDISLGLRDELEERGYSVLMIRETNDVDITNSERAQMANEAEADAFIRVHANGSESSSVSGAMTICQTPSNPYNSALYEDSRRLSELVLDAYTEATGIRKEYVWETDTMSGINWCTVPVTIIELGYMTNPEEDRKMQDADFQAQMVKGLADGIEAYLNEKGDDDPEGSDSAEIAETAKEAASAEDPDAAETAKAEEDPDAAETAAAAEASEESGTAKTAEIAEEIEPETPDGEDSEEEEGEEQKRREQEEERKREEKVQALRKELESSDAYTARKADRSAKEVKELISDTGDKIVKKYRDALYAKKTAEMQVLEEELKEEIGKLGGKWSLYLKRLDTGYTIGIHEDEKMIAASLIKLFIAGEFYALGEQGELDIDSFRNMPDLMISISDNGAANSLISACTMGRINEFAEENGFEETQLNRRMLEWNGTENYTSARDCGRMLEMVLDGEYVSGSASNRILDDLKAQQRRGKIPAGVPSGIETGNKTGELDNVDNDAAIVWSPSCTYILCIMSSDTGGRITEIRKLSEMVYRGMNHEEDN